MNVILWLIVIAAAEICQIEILHPLVNANLDIMIYYNQDNINV